MGNLPVWRRALLCGTESSQLQLQQRDGKYQPPLSRLSVHPHHVSDMQTIETEETPYTAETLSDEHKIPIRLTKKILYELQDMHMVYETSMDGDDESIGYLPSVDINRMNVAMLLNRLDIAGTEAFKIDKKRYSSSWEALANAREEYYKSTSKILLKDL